MVTGASLSWMEVHKSTSPQWDIRFSFCCFRCHKLTYLSPQCSPHRQRQLCQRCFIVGQISAAAGMHMISKADPLADLGQSLNISWTRISVNHFDFPQKHRNSEETSQELRMLSSVTINCQVTKIVMNPGSQLSVL